MAQRALTDDECREAMDQVEIYGDAGSASRALNIPSSTFWHRVNTAKMRGIGSTQQQLEVKQGNAPEFGLTHTIPQPLIVRGTSTMYDEDGKIKLQWVKTKLDDQLVQAAMIAAIEAMAVDIPRADPVTRPTHSVDALCNLYTFTDSHVGMYAWDKEAGDDWDLEIARDTLTKAFDYLVEASPPAGTGIILNLGDYMHYDGLSSVTPLHGNLLDADGRFSKMVKVGILILRYIINKALTRHENIVVIMAEGNHDPASSVWLRHLFTMLYENEPRIKVVNNETPYIVHQHGETMLAFHHGHLSKTTQLPLIFAAQYPKEWGATTKRFCHTGHKHHIDEKEYSGMRVRQHATLAARDAYAARGGWIANREITALTYHKIHGQVASTTCVPEMLV